MPQKTHITILCDEDPGVLVTEHLRYMGLLMITAIDHPNPLPDAISQFFTPRKATDVLVTVTCDLRGKKEQAIWAKQQMGRLESFLVSAALWIDGDTYPKVIQHTSRLGRIFDMRRRDEYIATELDKGNIDPLVDALVDNHYGSCTNCGAGALDLHTKSDCQEVKK
jgi:hypothetical protein